MVEIVKFVYVIIIFISLFLGANVEGRIKCKEDSGCQNELCEFPLIPVCLKPYFLFLSTKDGFCHCN
ncbi:Nodule Cysteine-Rich (NCR) secreted peptide [Medicago truncatula]|uniref:Nodule Cysteine-Rich (NCR) secreted peptide n=1 Tax=Medicago truncatula TaxID=3880 RepID=A0A072UYA8_MEDTR|nr:Nodule Cysteine-Rich (NCR) secreted peptide [Medicago truncatula]